VSVLIGLIPCCHPLTETGISTASWRRKYHNYYQGLQFLLLFCLESIQACCTSTRTFVCVLTIHPPTLVERRFCTVTCPTLRIKRIYQRLASGAIRMQGINPTYVGIGILLFSFVLNIAASPLFIYPSVVSFIQVLFLGRAIFTDIPSANFESKISSIDLECRPKKLHTLIIIHLKYLPHEDSPSCI
jgi:hypothetical protein